MEEWCAGRKDISMQNIQCFNSGPDPLLGSQCRKALRIGNPIQVDLETLELVMI